MTTENTALEAELSAADIAARRMTASVALIKALGGGWKADNGLKTASAVTPDASLSATREPR